MIKNKDITICYVVGGNEAHYQNLKRSIQSIKRTGFNGNFLILEVGNNLTGSSLDNIKVINDPDLINLTEPGKKGYLFWKQKYLITQKADTPYVVYLDTDTVMATNYLPKIFNKIKNKFGVSVHWWVPSFLMFFEMAVPQNQKKYFLQIKKELGFSFRDNFYAGGVFLFKKTKENLELLNQVLKIYNKVYKNNSEYIKGLTDEVFFSACLNKQNKYYILSGAINHSSMGDKYMPLRIKKGVLEGKNPFDQVWEPVLFLHCDINRRDPSQNYKKNISKKIQEFFKL